MPGESPGLTVSPLLVNVAVDRSCPCERAAMVDKRVASNRTIDLQHATVGVGVARAEVGSCQVECLRAGLGQRTAGPEVHTIVLEHAGKAGVQVVTAHGEVVLDCRQRGTASNEMLLHLGQRPTDSNATGRVKYFEDAEKISGAWRWR